MSNAHQSLSAWTLPQGRTLHRVTPQPRLLRVCSGRLWATLDARPHDASPPADWVLQAGAELLLQGGDGVVIEAFEDSRFEWLDVALPRA